MGDHWGAMLHNILRQARYAADADPGHWNDPDMLEIGNGGMSPREYRTQGRLVSRDGYVEVWLRPLSGGAYAIAMVNGGDMRVDFTSDWPALGLSGVFERKISGAMLISASFRPTTPRTSLHSAS